MKHLKPENKRKELPLLTANHMEQSSTLWLDRAGVPRNRQGYSELQPPCLLPYGCYILRTEPRTVHFDFSSVLNRLWEVYFPVVFPNFRLKT